jgi:hypothetical protein
MDKLDECTLAIFLILLAGISIYGVHWQKDFLYFLLLDISENEN